MKKPVIRKELVIIFGCKNYDWFGVPVTLSDKITYHHITKAENGGDETLENGALLTQSMHRLLHMMEFINPELYEEAKYWFEIINKTRRPLNEEFQEIMTSLKERIEIAEHLYQINKKSKSKNTTTVTSKVQEKTHEKKFVLRKLY